MNLKKKYENIIKEYGLKEEAKELFTIVEYAHIWEKYTAGLGKKSVAIYGGGGNGKLLLNELIRWNEEDKVECLIDNYSSGKYLNYEILTENEALNKTSIKLIWIASWKYRKEINKRVNEHFHFKIIDPYEILQSMGYLERDEDISRYAEENKYRWFSEKVAERELFHDDEICKTITRKLIAGYFCICDWIHFFEEINCYLRLDNKDSNKYKKLKCDTEEMIKLMSLECRNKITNGTVIFLVDSLSKYIVDDMPLLKKWKEGALSLNEYRNEYPSTKEFLTSMFTGWRPFEDGSYKSKVIQYSDSDLLHHISKENITIKYLISDVKIAGSFKKINAYEDKYSENVLISEVFFNGFCEFLKGDDEQITIIYTSDTIHPNFYTPVTHLIDYDKSVDSYKLFRYQFGCAVKYTDDLLHFYLTMMDSSVNITKIVMGDHGINPDTQYNLIISRKKSEYLGAQWDKKIISPALLIKGKGIVPAENNELISTNQFVDILHAIIKKEDPLGYLSYNDNIPLEIVPGYDNPWIDLGLKSDNYLLPVGANGVMNKKYIYLEFENGNKLLYIIEDDKIRRLISSEDIEKAVESLGNDIINIKFPCELLNDDFFENHNKKFAEIINRIDLEKTKSNL